MANCTKCGAVLSAGATFCGSCGTPVTGTAPASTPRPGAPAAGTTTSGGLTSNVAGALAYLFGFITGIVFLVIDPFKNDKFVRFHAFQSIIFNVAVIVLWIVFAIISGILSYITAGIAGLILFPISMLLWLAMMAFWVFLMYKAYNNERFMIPIIGALAAKQAG